MDLLRSTFLERRERNTSYSMRAFARDLGISSSLLSRVLSGSRPMTLKLAMQIATALDLNKNNSEILMLSVIRSSSSNAKISKKVRIKLEKTLSETEHDSSNPLYTTIEIERFKAMASWYHLAILNLTTLDMFRSDPIWIAKKLGIATAEAREAIERLLDIGLLSKSGDNLKRTRKHFYIKTSRSEFAVRKFHEQMISRAAQELKNINDDDFQKRLINGVTFTCGPEHIEIIKDKINKFEDEVLALTSLGRRSSVYQINVQFFPLTSHEQEDLL